MDDFWYYHFRRHPNNMIVSNLWHGIIQSCDTPLPVPQWLSQVNMSHCWWGTGFGVQLEHYELVLEAQANIIGKRISSIYDACFSSPSMLVPLEPTCFLLDAKRWTITRLIRWARSHVGKSQHRQSCEGSLNVVVYAQCMLKSGRCMPSRISLNRHMYAEIRCTWPMAHVLL